MDEKFDVAYYEYTVFRRADKHTDNDVALSAPYRDFEEAEKTAVDWRKSGTFGGEFFVKRRPVGLWEEVK